MTRIAFAESDFTAARIVRVGKSQWGSGTDFVESAYESESDEERLNFDNV